MAAIANTKAGAPETSLIDWKTIDWESAKKQVYRLQMRIAKAFRKGKHGKAKALQWILTHSWYAKLLAVKRVTQNKGAKTPGIDNIVWKTAEQKIEAAKSLKRKGYQTQPLKRIYIPKKQKGKLRPLSIPPMKCRAMQALHLLALEPVMEMMTDNNAYGFRPLRCTADAVRRCFYALCHKGSPEYILEGDIKACFDTISFQWMLDNILTDKQVLEKWLKAGYVEKGKLYPTQQGVSQGGVISPALLNITLSGLEKAILKQTKERDKVHVSLYADDFVVTGVSEEVLREKVIPTIEAFLQERGLKLSKEKSKITHINDGFDFLGFNIRKYNGKKLIIKPAKSNIKSFLRNIKQTIKENAAASAENLIWQLNPKIRGWTNYYQHSCAKKIFGSLSHEIFLKLWRWAKRRHPNKPAKWIRAKYFRSRKLQNWIFSAIDKSTGKRADLIETGTIPIVRYNKIRAQARKYDPQYEKYLYARKNSSKLYTSFYCDEINAGSLT